MSALPSGGPPPPYGPYGGYYGRRRGPGFWWFLIPLVFFGILVVFFLVFWWSAPAGVGRGYYFWPFFPLGFLLFLFLIFAVLRFAFWGARWHGRGGYGHRDPGARAILRRRYARGEITREQFLQMSRDLEGGGPGGPPGPGARSP